MPVVNPTNSLPPAQAPSPVKITAPAYKGVSVDTRYTPLASLITHVEGAAWSVEYYSQVLQTGNQPQGQQLDLGPESQQYRLVRSTILRVSQPLSSSQDNEGGGSMVVTGTATTPPGIVPNIGDMFLADIGGGKEGIFQVTQSVRKSIMQDSVYEIEYRLIDNSTTERRNDLYRKIVQTVVYVADYLKFGMNPLLQLNDFELDAQLAGWYDNLIDGYLKQFLSNEFRTFLLPGQTSSFYDPFLTPWLVENFYSNRQFGMSRVRVLNCEDDAVMSSVSVWDALKARDRTLLRAAFKSVTAVLSSSFTREPMLEGVHFSGIRNVVYPISPSVGVDFAADYLPKLPSANAITVSESAVITLPDLPAANVSTNDSVPALTGTVIHPAIGEDGEYVLSENFYQKHETDQSYLEVRVQKYFDGTPQVPSELLALARHTPQWSPLERFYLVPVLLLLIRSHLKMLS